MIRQGEVYNHMSGRVVVVSSDRVNEEAYPIVAIMMGRTEEILPYLVGTTEADPIRGAVNIGAVGFLPGGLDGKPVCMLTGATMSRVLQSVRDLFDQD